MPEKMRALWKGTYDDTKDADGALLTRYPRAHLSGVPARSLTQDDWEALTPEQQDAVRASALYQVRTEAEMRSASTSAPQPETQPDTAAATSPTEGST